MARASDLQTHSEVLIKPDDLMCINIHLTNIPPWTQVSRLPDTVCRSEEGVVILGLVDTRHNDALYMITGSLRSTPLSNLPALASNPVTTTHTEERLYFPGMQSSRKYHNLLHHVVKQRWVSNVAMKEGGGGGGHKKSLSFGAPYIAS